VQVETRCKGHGYEPGSNTVVIVHVKTGKCNESLDVSDVNQQIADQTSYASSSAIATWGASLAR